MQCARELSRPRMQPATQANSHQVVTSAGPGCSNGPPASARQPMCCRLHITCLPASNLLPASIVCPLARQEWVRNRGNLCPTPACCRHTPGGVGRWAWVLWRSGRAAVACWLPPTPLPPLPASGPQTRWAPARVHTTAFMGRMGKRRYQAWALHSWRAAWQAAKAGSCTIIVRCFKT